MPNWTHNKLTISGELSARSQFRTKAVGIIPRYMQPAILPTEEEPAETVLLSFHSFIPVPDTIQQRSFGGEDEARQAKERGVPCDCQSPDHCGYSWELEHWGVKWGACGTVVEESSSSLIYLFDTAWMPPIIFAEEVSRLYPTLQFRLEFISAESGFIGKSEFVDGRQFDAEFRDIVWEELFADDSKQCREQNAESDEIEAINALQSQGVCHE